MANPPAEFTGLHAVVLDELIGRCEALYCPNISLYMFHNFQADMNGSRFFKGRIAGLQQLVIINLRTMTVEVHRNDSFDVFHGDQIAWEVLGEQFRDAR